MVAYMDKLVGKLLARLQELGLRENTLVHTELAKAQPVSIILKLFKLAVRVVQYKDRIRLSLPASCPMKGVLARMTELLYLVPRPPAPA